MTNAKLDQWVLRADSCELRAASWYERALRHVACSMVGLGVAMALDETFTNLAAFLNSLDAEGEQKFELSHSLVIICPDCGKNIAFRGRCPKCAGNSWIPAGQAGGIFDRTKAQRLRRMIADDDDVTVRGTAAVTPTIGTETAMETTAVDTQADAAPNGRRKKKKTQQTNGDTPASTDNGDELSDRS